MQKNRKVNKKECNKKLLSTKAGTATSSPPYAGASQTIQHYPKQTNPAPYSNSKVYFQNNKS